VQALLPQGGGSDCGPGAPAAPGKPAASPLQLPGLGKK
jgi:lipopolysaccharide export system protein LptA